MTRAERHLLELCGRTLTLVLWHVEKTRQTRDELPGALDAMSAALDALRREDRKESEK